MTHPFASRATPEPTDMPEPTAPFLRACRGLEADYTPIWFMRQAGRYIAEYRALRADHDMLEMIFTPELAAESVRTAIRALDSLTGRIDVETILGEIFSSFCIGK